MLTSQEIAYRAEATRAFQAAEDVWQAELVARFGKDAGNARYLPRGKGEPGSRLRVLHDMRQTAQALFRAAW